MNRGKALVQLSLSVRQQQLLCDYLGKHTISLHYQQRINIILLSFDGLSNHRISKDLSTSRPTIAKWRTRWLTHYEDLCAYEIKEAPSDTTLLLRMLNILSDKPRSGAPVQISLSEKENLIALACKKPEDFGIPVTHWNREMLAQVAISEGLVEKISPSYVSRVLKK